MMVIPPNATCCNRQKYLSRIANFTHGPKKTFVFHLVILGVGKQKDKEIDSELEQKTHHFPDFLGENVCHPMATIKLRPFLKSQPEKKGSFNSQDFSGEWSLSLELKVYLWG